MKIPKWLKLYGDYSYRGDCASESVEQITFFSRLRREYPLTYGAIAIHPRNEQQLKGGQFRSLNKHKAEGMTPGAADIVIPGNPSFVCEMKRRDHTKSKWQDGQIEYLSACNDAGAFVCVALGCDAAKQAFNDYLKIIKK